jgi:hypothetical protein
LPCGKPVEKGKDFSTEYFYLAEISHRFADFFTENPQVLHRKIHSFPQVH